MKQVFREVADHAIFTYQFHEAENNVDDERAKQLALDYITSDDYRGDFPIVVCLCGSTRFYEAFQRAYYDETMAGRIVLSVGFYAGSPGEMIRQHGEGVGITPEQKIALDELHMRKIDMADEVLVLNVGGYIGESTARELAYAQANGKRVRYLESSDRAATVAEVPGAGIDSAAGAGDDGSQEG